MKKYFLLSILFILFTFSISLSGQGGMWLPNLLEGLNEQEMQDLGMELSVQDIYDINHSSIKDAIVNFGGCTAEIISSQGLIMTNHHCSYSRIHGHSTLENNLLKDGFWAMNKSDELPNPNMTVSMIESIEDITDKALAGVEMAQNGRERQSIIDRNLNEIRNKIELKNYQKIEIRPFYYGNKYYLFVTKVFSDIRLVGAPPESIGKFGADTDNWAWPRHNADFALFRIYVDKNNLPSSYSEDNVPYKPDHYLPISMDGVEKGDFTLVYGFPGRTWEYLPAIAIDQRVNVVNPIKISARQAMLTIFSEFMHENEANRHQYASKFASISNYWKKWIGENQGLKSSGAIEQKLEDEKEFMRRVNGKEAWKSDYGTLLSEFDSLYKEREIYAITQSFIYESIIRYFDLKKLVDYYGRLISIYNDKAEEDYLKYKDKLLSNVEDRMNKYDKEVESAFFVDLMGMYKEKIEERFLPESLKGNVDVSELADLIYKESIFTDHERMKDLLNQDDRQHVIETMEADPAFRLFAEIGGIYNFQVAPEYNKIMSEINVIQKEYMKALMEVFPEKRFFPDANSTIRVTYGKVDGFSPKDAIYYKPSTYLSGVIEKYKPGDYEFDLPSKFIELYETGDFGKYADETGDVPVCFIGTNHTTGGNSGSPAIDAKGNLVGLNFDRVWEGTMSDLYYDPQICRNIMVDARYILFIIDIYGGAGHLIEEMDIVYPKNGNSKTFDF